MYITYDSDSLFNWLAFLPESHFYFPVQKLDGIFSPPVLSLKSKLGIQQYNVLVKRLGSAFTLPGAKSWYIPTYNLLWTGSLTLHVYFYHMLNG